MKRDIVHAVFTFFFKPVLKALARLESRIMTKLDELQTEVQETKAASAAVLEALTGTRSQITDLQAKLEEALAANDGEATNAKIQEAIDGLNEVQANLAAALPADEDPAA